MLNFRNTNIFFIVLLSVLLGVSVKYGIPVYIYGFLLIAYALIVFWGCVHIRSGFFIPVVCNVSTDKKEIAISFDDGPVQNYTPEILQILKKEDVKAAFFCIGNRIAGNEELLKQIHEEGHLIGNHSFSHHLLFDLYPAKKMEADLKLMDAEMERVLGIRPKLFRPPYGVTNPNVKKAIVKGGYTPVGWSVRSMDTVNKVDEKLLAKVNNGIAPGAVFLFHDTSKTTLNILAGFIKEVKKRGYTIIPLDKLLALKAYA